MKIIYIYIFEYLWLVTCHSDQLIEVQKLVNATFLVVLQGQNSEVKNDKQSCPSIQIVSNGSNLHPVFSVSRLLHIQTTSPEIGGDQDSTAATSEPAARNHGVSQVTIKNVEKCGKHAWLWNQMILLFQQNHLESHSVEQQKTSVVGHQSCRAEWLLHDGIALLLRHVAVDGGHREVGVSHLLPGFFSPKVSCWSQKMGEKRKKTATGLQKRRFNRNTKAFSFGF